MILLNKPVGQTPLQALDKLRIDQPELKDERLSYAGRLDPMAEGLMLVLVGEENNRREEFLGLDKEYEVEILFGMETDTYDVLGLVRGADNNIDPSKNIIISYLDKFVGKVNLPYPPYSSRPVNGKPLFQWAREGKIDEIELPKQDSCINSIELLGFSKIKKTDLEKHILESIQKVVGDFRQEEIIKNWKEFFKDSRDITQFTTAKIKVTCTSGAYMRSIAHELGKMLGVKAIALSIKRTRIGDYKI